MDILPRNRLDEKGSFLIEKNASDKLKALNEKIHRWTGRARPTL
jgi:hypothetical protein